MLSIVELAKHHNQSPEEMAVDELHVYYILGHPIEEALDYFKSGVVDVLYDPSTRVFFPVYNRLTTIPKVHK